MRTKKLLSFLGLFIFAAGVLYVLAETAEAARLGGGKSFGSRPSYQRSAPAPSPSPTSPQLSPGQSTPQMPGTAPAMGRWGGMLGGMLMGGLIGSRLFGGGHRHGGPGLMDLVIVGGGLSCSSAFYALEGWRPVPLRRPVPCHLSAALPRVGGVRAMTLPQPIAA